MENISTEFIYMPFINFAMQQNHIPVVRTLQIQNNGTEDLADIVVEIASEPDFMAVWTSRVDYLTAGQTFAFDAVNPVISFNFLSSLTERVSGQFSVTVFAGGAIVAKKLYPVTVLAYDQWNGVATLPELIAAFVTPNHSEISKIIGAASEILEKWTGSPSFDEYQSRNPDRVLRQAAAIYEAIAARQIVYVTAPASFEDAGQRVRLCETVLSHKLGNCLDLSLLYAACLEAAGIHPLIVFTQGHAFVGAWLIDECFSDPVNDDPALLTKRTASGISEIILVEATCMSAGNNASFEDAVRAANFKMVRLDEFNSFVDIKRARHGGIRPLPLRVLTSEGFTIVEEIVPERKSVMPETLGQVVDVTGNGSAKISKRMLWERKLLDLTLRNSLLNLRITKGTVQFISVDLGKLEDVLADGDEVQILSKPTDWDNPLKNSGVYQAINQSDPINDLVKKELGYKRLRSYLTEGELTQTLTSIYRSSRQSLEENGANTLYIALGLLRWYETATSERPRYAPILLLPIEIVKKSAQKGFVIRSREEETLLNITLLEMLRQDFDINITGLDNLPKDESGVDVKLVFTLIRKAIMAKQRWDVEEQAFLGTFSFNKFVLWNDIHNNVDKLTANPIVKSLISGKLEWHDQETELESESIEFDPASLSLPISTDSSQLQAILSSSNGKSFVLHGPPGTGKSQTITNIIANAVYAGKKVLFVAAKKAALDVVESRLESIGIGPFCLELHSNKSKKSAILEQLKKATEVTKTQSPPFFQDESQRLLKSRTELGEYVKALHHQHEFGFSLFDAFNNYVQIAHKSDKLPFPANFFNGLTAPKVREIEEAVEQIQLLGSICGMPRKHPLEGIRIREFSHSVKDEADKELDTYRQLLENYQKYLGAAQTALKINTNSASKSQDKVFDDLIGLLKKLPDVPSQLFAVDQIEQTLPGVIEISKCGQTRDRIKEDLLRTFTSSVLGLDAELLLASWQTASNQWFLPRFLGQRKVLKTMQSYGTTGKVSNEQIQDILQKIINYKAQQGRIDKAVYLPEMLGFLWKGGEGDWSQISGICEDLIAIHRKFIELNSDQSSNAWRKDLSISFGDGSKVFFTRQEQVLSQAQTVIRSMNDAELSLSQLLSIDFSSLPVLESSWSENNLVYVKRWQSALGELRDWVAWNNCVEKADALGISTIVRAYRDGQVEGNDVVGHFKKGFYRAAAIYIIDKNPVLAAFNGRMFEEKVKKFRQLSQHFDTLTKQELYARLASRIPSAPQEASQTSEMGILQRNIRNNGRATSIRKLFDSIPNLLPRLTPCMLMSPISVAQYFDADRVKFDLVIFDEASQLQTCEAVGAIARGASVIVVGDPKQMPPTSFFSSNNVDEENIDIEDMESILDDCLAISMPSHHLLWHYRSKHESLIAFSNSKYYDNKLLTFPSTDDIHSMVKHVPVRGFYDKGKTRQNQAEAKAIVAEVVSRLSSPSLSKRSVGVVTFSSVQQNLIEDLLSEEFKKRPELEKVAYESKEPLFVKNLENVQGDERDVILFSICYGPNEEGKPSVNFGPINREGGWRRLNVAVSRARYEMKVFATMASDQIDLTRTKSEGVAGLKSFLAYAERGKTALPVRTVSHGKSESGFERELARQLEELGYAVHTNIGCSDFKIDIGIVNPLNEGEYLIGVLCDGYNYNKAKNSRDREIVQKDVLHSLGWTTHRVWSMDWWENSQRTLDGIVDAIEAARTNYNVKKEKVEIEQVMGEAETYQPKIETVPSTIFNAAPQPQLTASSAKKYEVALVETILAKSSDDFLQPFNRQKISHQIMTILESESPISKNLLSKRLLAAWGIARNGSRTAAHIDNILPTLSLQTTQKGKNVIFWKTQHNPSEYAIYRLSELEIHKRDADDLPPEEVANAVKEVLVNQISLPKAELVRETSKLMGYARAGSNVEMAMSFGIEAAVSKGYCVDEDGRIVLK
ncbi:Superfamily I DNA and/or RNA helicase [Dyadobacter sp. SG02]|uniref:DUF3320 domain-containing protein n=1 Tax=Dyadobacter sp. SG02 TaxID=1855291 RepID=UPI0008CAC2EF|nr:DUF3320 domain-containing protein [Dyadobacter sp. SG02]SEI82910.1 Superfamily I DNA and/or RNA helicase [Dyadobacter sp. SG02]